MNAAAGYETLFDLAATGWEHGPMLAIGSAVLVAALMLLVMQWRRGRSRVLPGFAVAVGLILQVVAALAWWETELLLADLRSGKAQVAEGVVQSHEVRERAFWNSSSKRYDRSTWEAFLVGDLAFGFTRGGQAVGFTNAASPHVALADGEWLRVHYVEQTAGDFASRRILKLERGDRLQPMKHSAAAVQRD